MSKYLYMVTSCMLPKTCLFLLPNWGAKLAPHQSSGKASEDGATEVWMSTEMGEFTNKHGDQPWQNPISTAKKKRFFLMYFNQLGLASYRMLYIGASF